MRNTSRCREGPADLSPSRLSQGSSGERVEPEAAAPAAAAAPDAPRGEDVVEQLEARGVAVHDYAPLQPPTPRAEDWEDAAEEEFEGQDDEPWFDETDEFSGELAVAAAEGVDGGEAGEADRHHQQQQGAEAKAEPARHPRAAGPRPAPRGAVRAHAAGGLPAHFDGTEGRGDEEAKVEEQDAAAAHSPAVSRGKRRSDEIAVGFKSASELLREMAHQKRRRHEPAAASRMADESHGEAQ